MDVSMLALLSKTTNLMEHLGFLWVLQTGMELNLWAELETPANLAELTARHPDWDAVLLEHWLEQAFCQELLSKKDGYYQTNKLAKAVNKYKNYGLEALYKELMEHWCTGFAELPRLITRQREKLNLGSEMEEELISKASLASEPFVWPFLRTKCQRENWKRVLDLGCGEGRYLTKLADEFPQLQGIGLEMNPAVASRAQERVKKFGGRIQIFCRDILLLENLEEELGEELGVFDLCLMNNSVYYFGKEQQIQLLNNIKRFLAPEGQLGILTAVRKGAPVRIFKTHVPQNLMSFFLACHQGFQGLPTQQDIEDLFKLTGYKDVNISVMPLGTSHYFFAKGSVESREMTR